MLVPDILLQDRYQIVRPIGQGGVGAVFQALDARLGNTVAVKQILRCDAALRAAFEREARLLAALSHPVLPKVTDYFIESHGQFLVMEYVPGNDLATSVLGQQKAPAVELVVRWADQLLDALAYLHKQNPPVVHRDIKPHNLKVNAQGEIVLLDFGLAKGASDNSAERSIAGYTLHYAPPEQLRGKPTDARSDLYALAASLYALLAAKEPVDALSRLGAVAVGDPDPLQPLDRINRAVLPQLAQVIHRALALDPAQRFADAAAMRLALLGVDGDPTTVPIAVENQEPPAPRSNLPVQLTSFFGRETELDAVQQLLVGDMVRLVTLVGPGGIGKTRMAISVAARCLAHFRDGVFFVPLASIGEADLVLPAIAQALGLREVANMPLLQSLQTHLQNSQTLLVLDNFEQVLSVAPLLNDLLMTCPRLAVLVTSRAALQIVGEQEFPVPVLALPDGKRLPPLAELEQFAAIKLFVQRAQSMKPSFVLDSANAATVVEICMRLDGLPLAIELAAASIKFLPVPAILDRLAEHLTSLRNSAHNVPDRQRTLYASIAWSYDLLDADEQALFRRLAVFAGSFSLEAAEALCKSLQARATSVLADIASLIDKSLLKPFEATADEPRFTMLQTIREFGLQQLSAASEAQEVKNKHADYYCRFARVAGQKMWGAQLADWVGRLETEIDNLRVALTHNIAHPERAEQSLQLSGSLWRFWEMYGYVAEGRSWLDRALQQSPNAYPASRWLTLHGAGNLAVDQGEYGVAEGHYQESLALLQKLLPTLAEPNEIRSTQRGLANTMTNLGHIAFLQSNYQQAISSTEDALALHRHFENKIGQAIAIYNLAKIHLFQSNYTQAEVLGMESLALYRELGDERGIGWNLDLLGTVARQRGDYVQAATLYAECRTLFEKVSNRADMASLFLNLGEMAREQGKYTKAETHYRAGLSIARAMGNKMDIANLLDRLSLLACYKRNLAKAMSLSQQSIALHRELGNLFGLGTALHTRGYLAHVQQHYAAAADDYRESLRLQAQLGDQRGMIDSFHALAALNIVGEKLPRRAVRLLYAAESVRCTLNICVPERERAEHAAQIDHVRALLDKAAFAAAAAEGKAMSLEEAVAYALEES